MPISVLDERGKSKAARSNVVLSEQPRRPTNNELSSQPDASKDFLVVEPFAPVELFASTLYFSKKVQFNCLLDSSVIVEVFQGV